MTRKASHVDRNPGKPGSVVRARSLSLPGRAGSGETRVWSYSRTATGDRDKRSERPFKILREEIGFPKDPSNSQSRQSASPTHVWTHEISYCTRVPIVPQQRVLS